MAKKKPEPAPFVQPYKYPSPHIPMAAIRRFARRIAAKFQPEKIILFGSYAYGTPHNESDVDLLVVMPCRNGIDQALRIELEFEAPFSLDLVVRKPSQVTRGLKDNDSFIHEIIGHGKVLYEAVNLAVGAEGGRRHARHAGTVGLAEAAGQHRVLPRATMRRKVPQGAAARTGANGAEDT